MSKGTVNKVNLIGNVGQDPKIVNFDNGGKVANLSLATTESWNNKDGEPQDKTEWHNVVISGKVADVVEKYVKKGSKIYIEGRIETRKYTDKDGVEKYITDIKAFNMQMLDSKGGQPNADSNESAPQQPKPSDGVKDNDDISF